MENEVACLEEQKSNLFAIMKTYGFPAEFFNFSEQRKNDGKDEKENPTYASDNSTSPSPKRRKLTVESNTAGKIQR